MRRLQRIACRIAQADPPGSMYLGDLVMTKSELESAVSNLSRGLASQTPGPVEVAYMSAEDKYHLTNGYHRAVEAIVRGEDTLPVEVSKGEATWGMPPEDDLFVYDPGEQYGGMEEFIEYYLLKRL